MSYFAIIHACLLVLTGALLIQLTGMLLRAVSETVSARLQAHRDESRRSAKPPKGEGPKQHWPRLHDIHLKHTR